MSLSQLDMPVVFDSGMKAHLKRVNQEMKEYEEKYGEGWHVQYEKDHGRYVDYDVDMKLVNTAIWHGTHPCMYRTGHPESIIRLREKYEARIRELFDGKYEFHEPNIPEINEVLLADAMRTGKSQELPDVLQSVYHYRVFGVGDED